MQRISIPYTWELAVRLKPLSNIQVGAKLGEWFGFLYAAETSLDEFLNQSVWRFVIKASQAPGQKLLQAIKKLTITPVTDWDTKIFDWIDSYSITNGVREFESVFTAEMNVADTYLVSKKRGYDTLDLISQAEVLFPFELQVKVPEAVPDVQQAGKCIAFELPTAAGFHLHRANESVLHRYFDGVTHGAPRPTNRNMGDYLGELSRLNAGDAVVRSALRDLKDLYRNPLIHPEHSLESVDEAIALLGSVQAAIVHMLRVIPMPPPVAVPTPPP